MLSLDLSSSCKFTIMVSEFVVDDGKEKKGYNGVQVANGSGRGGRGKEEERQEQDPL